jgi:single-strand DNA-binding protein
MSNAVAPLTAKVGRLTENPELRFGKTGTAFTTVGLAVKPWTPPGEPEADTVFYEVVAFGSLAEHVAECLVKGDRVVVTGKGELERWTGRDGVERVKKKLIADGIGPDLRFCGDDVHRVERREVAPVARQTFENEEPF